MNTNDESYICDLRFAFEQPLASRSAELTWLWIPMMKVIFVIWGLLLSNL